MRASNRYKREPLGGTVDREMIWRELVFDYFWERASPLGRMLIIAVVLGAFVLLAVAIFRLGEAGQAASRLVREPATTSLTTTVRAP